MNNSRIRLAILVGLAISILLGGLLVYDYNTAPAGYAAVYTVLGMWVLTVLLALIGPLLLTIRRTRFAGIVLAATAVLVPVTFFCGVKASQMAGLNQSSGYSNHCVEHLRWFTSTNRERSQESPYPHHRRKSETVV